MSSRPALGLPGVSVGCWTGAGTGVTVVLLPPGATASAEVRGGAPATRELALLEPGRLVEHADALVLTGGSAFGLAAADGVVRFLARSGRGFPTSVRPVPIVPAAAIFDLGESGVPPPGPAEGEAAARRASAEVPIGRVGAGAGATVGKWRGSGFGSPGGQGVAVHESAGVAVGALAVVNAVGDVVDAAGEVLAGSSAPPDAGAFPDPAFGGLEHTTLVVVATDARATKLECRLLAESAHVGVAHAVRPSHTRFDGDVAFAVATGEREADLDRLRLAAVDAVAAAVRAAVAGGGAPLAGEPGRDPGAGGTGGTGGPAEPDR